MAVYKIENYSFNIKNPPDMDFSLSWYSNDFEELKVQADLGSDLSQREKREKALSLIQRTNAQIKPGICYGWGEQNGFLLQARPLLKALLKEEKNENGSDSDIGDDTHGNNVDADHSQIVDHILYGYLNKEMAEIYDKISDLKRSWKYLKAAVKSLRKVAEKLNDPESLIALALTEKKLAQTARQYKSNQPQKQEKALLLALGAIEKAQEMSDRKEVEYILVAICLDLASFYQEQKEPSKALIFYLKVIFRLSLSRSDLFALPESLPFEYEILAEPMLEAARLMIQYTSFEKEEINALLLLSHNQALPEVNKSRAGDWPEYQEALLKIAGLLAENESMDMAVKLIEQSHQMVQDSLESKIGQDLITYYGLQMGLGRYGFASLYKKFDEGEQAIREYERAREWFERVCQNEEKDQDSHNNTYKMALLFKAMCTIFMAWQIKTENPGEESVLSLSKEAVEIVESIPDTTFFFGRDYFRLQKQSILFLAYECEKAYYGAHQQKDLKQKAQDNLARAEAGLKVCLEAVRLDNLFATSLSAALYCAQMYEKDPSLVEFALEY